MTSRKSVVVFRREVWNYYKKNARNDLPWRKTTDPYKILVSEIMLQQTQVPRVIEKYRSFIKKFPTVEALARSNLAQVLKEWNGLGYNRRAKYLHDAARVIVNEYVGNLKKALEHPLSGVGPYTRAAVGTFAFNEPHAMIETNIRSAIIHHFFPVSTKSKRGESLLEDAKVMRIAALASEGQDPRTWHWALMDYGSHLKRTGVRNNDRSAHYVKQSKFEGSLRQFRGAILRELHRGSTSLRTLISRLNPDEQGLPLLKKALAGLERDGLIKKEKGKWRIA